MDGRSDLYSLGVALYEMLTGRLPFDAADALAVAYAHVNDPLPELPRELAAWQSVVDRLLAKSPEDRYGSARGLAEVLETDGLPRPPATRVMPVTREPGVDDAGDGSDDAAGGAGQAKPGHSGGGRDPGR